MVCFGTYLDASFVVFRYDSQEVLVNSCHNLYRHSIRCTFWPYFDSQLFVRNFYCIHINAPGNWKLVIPSQMTNLFMEHVCFVSDFGFVSFCKFFSPLSKAKDEQNGKMELVDVHDNHRCVPTILVISVVWP